MGRMAGGISAFPSTGVTVTGYARSVSADRITPGCDQIQIVWM